MSGSSYDYARSWYLKNQDAVRAYRRARYATKREKLQSDQRAWYASHKDQVRIYDATPSRREGRRRATRVWKMRNPDKVRLSNFLREWRAQRAPGTCSVAAMAARIAFYGNVCAYCGGPYEHIDHVIPLARGGTNWPANLRPACGPCNLSKGSFPLLEFLKRRVTVSCTK